MPELLPVGHISQKDLRDNQSRFLLMFCFSYVYYYFRLMAVFSGEPVTGFPVMSSFTSSGREPLGTSGKVLFCTMDVLPFTKPSISVVVWPYPFFAHHWTADKMSIAAFMPTFHIYVLVLHRSVSLL